MVMTLKKLQRLLYDYPYMADKVEELNRQINEEREQSQAIIEATGIVIDGLPRGKRLADPTYKKVEDSMMLHDRRVAHLLSQREEVVAKRHFVEDLLQRLSRDEYTVIEARYFEQLSWETVPRHCKNKSRRACIDAHNRAIGVLLKDCPILH